MIKNTEEESNQPALDQLVEISRHFGIKNEYVIAGGGNTSYKNKDEIWIKASGTSLANIELEGFVQLSREKLKRISTKSYSRNSAIRESQVKEDLHSAIVTPTTLRPSVETSLHEIIDFPFVVHTHPTLVNAIMCSKRSKRTTKKLFGKEALYVKYTDPGYILFKKVEEEIIQYRDKFGVEPSIIFLQNHGVFVSGNSVEEIKKIYTDIESKIKDALDRQLPDNKTLPSVEYAKKFSNKIADNLAIEPSRVLYRTNSLIQYFVRDSRYFEKIDKPFTPDDIVYCKSTFLFVSEDNADLKEEVNKFQTRNGYMPKIIALQGKGLIAIDESEKSIQTVMDVFENMMKVSYLSENFGGPRFMTPEQINFIDNWEVENYRRQQR